MTHAVIIGGGHAAPEAVVALRQKGWQGDITIISDEPHLPYQRPPLSKAYFSGDISADNMPIKKQVVFDKTNTQLRLGRRATSIDRQEQLVTLDNGDTIAYSKLIIATGTRARKLPIPGANLPCVHYLRTLDDVTQIRQQVAKDTRLLIVGAGYIGLELAASANKLGAKVTVLETVDRVLARVTCEAMSTFYQDLHRAAGVDIRLNSGVKAFERQGNAYQALLADDTTIDFDCVVVGIGVLPNVEIAQEAGLACDNGIIVDEFTQTADSNIYAVGDCSNHPNELYQRRLRLESVPNANDQAKAAAASICDKPKAYTSLPWFWSDQYDVKLQTAGLSQGYTETVVRGNVAAKEFCIFYLKDDVLIALDAINSPADFMKAKQLIPQQATFDKQRLADTSTPWY